MNRSVSVLFVLLIVSTSFLVSQTPYREMEVKNGAAIRGTVRFTGKLLEPEMIPVVRDTAACGKSKRIESIITGKGNGVQNAIVFLTSVSAGKKWPPGNVPSLDQKDCEYQPHVMIVRAGEKMEIANSDPLLHNVHAYSLESQEPNQVGLPTLFNIALPVKGLRIPRTMAKPGMVMTLCDAGHPWMNAYILVAENPYCAITEENGSFVLDGVPPGTYTVKMWHSGMGRFEKTTKAFVPGRPFEQEKKVTVEAGKAITLDFDLTL